MLAILQVRAAHKVVHDTEAPGEAGEVHLGPSDAYQGHTRPREEPEEKYKWWGWRYASVNETHAFPAPPRAAHARRRPSPSSCRYRAVLCA